jgi:hypothetical protein
LPQAIARRSAPGTAFQSAGLNATAVARLLRRHLPKLIREKHVSTFSEPYDPNRALGAALEPSRMQDAEGWVAPLVANRKH